MQTAGARLTNSPTTLCNVPDQDEVRIESGRDVSLTQETEARGGIPACELGDAVVGETALAFFRDERRQQISLPPQPGFPRKTSSVWLASTFIWQRQHATPMHGPGRRALT